MEKKKSNAEIASCEELVSLQESDGMHIIKQYCSQLYKARKKKMDVRTNLTWD